MTSLEALGLLPDRPAEAWSPIAGVRLTRAGEPAVLGLFFSLDEH